MKVRKIVGYPNFDNLGMRLKTFTTTLSLRSFTAPAAWTDGKLVSSSSSSDDFCQELASEAVLWICITFFLPLLDAAAES